MKKGRKIGIFFLFIITILFFSCKKEKKTLHFNKNIEVVMGVFPTKDIQKISQNDLKSFLNDKELPKEIKNEIESEILNSKDFKVEIKGPEEIPFPNVSYVKTFGFGFTDEDAVECASAGSLLLLTFKSPCKNIFKKNLGMMWLSYLLSKKFDGYIYDLESKELFTNNYYRDFNLKDNFNDLRIHILVQKYPYTPGSFRIVTLGMAKFGCPDIEIRDFKTTASLSLQRLCYGVCKKLIDMRKKSSLPPTFPRTLSIKVKEIYKATNQLSGEGEQLEQVIKLMFRIGKYENGDSQKNIVKVLPPEKMDMDKWCDDVSGKVAGFIIKRKYDVSESFLKKVYEEAQKNLSIFEQHYENRDKKDHFFVKISVKCRNIEELIWLKVIGKKDNNYIGITQGDAAGCSDITAGMTFQVKPKEIRDWIVVLKKGKVIGDFGKKMEKVKK